MKFKIIYLYGLIFILSAAVITIVSLQERSPDVDQEDFNSLKEIPDDEIHNNFKVQGNSEPSEENVSQAYHKKLAELKKAVEEKPDDTLAMRRYADFLSASHQTEKAIYYYNKILEVDPNRNEINFSLAIIYYNKGDLKKAEAFNNNVLKTDPDNLIAIYNLGAISATRGNKKNAREFWNKVIQINADSETGILAMESLERLK